MTESAAEPLRAEGAGATVSVKQGQRRNGGDHVMNGDVAASLVQSLGMGHERVHIVRNPELSLEAVIAIHSTVLGPALGALRMWSYAHGLAEAVDDALRRSRAMTLKASASGLDLGGGKAVVVDDGRRELRSNDS